MDKLQNFRAAIPPVPDEPGRPLWSVMIPTFNCARFLTQTLTSVLDQDLGPAAMQIEVIDDHSTEDDPREVVEAVGADRVGFFQQQANVGHIMNFETCLRRAQGRLIHLLHGDDYVRNGFYRRMGDAFTHAPEAGAAFCRSILMNNEGHWESITAVQRHSSGILENALSRLASEQCIMTPSIVVRREVYERLGGFDSRLLCAEDWEMWVRVAAHYPVWFEPEPLAVYRMHSGSSSGRHTITGVHARYTGQAIRVFESYLPREEARAIAACGRTTYARATLDTAFVLLKDRNLAGAARLSREALRLSSAPRVLAHAVRLAGSVFLR